VNFKMANIKINDLQAANLNPSTSELFNELTEAEISDIHGGLGPAGAVGGAIIGAIGNFGYQLGAGRVGPGRGWNWGSLGLAVGGGAVTGFTGGAAAWYVVPRVTFFGMFSGGRMGW
jgi:lactobin A/cerein 7B family class IIb bacteriocin